MFLDFSEKMVACKARDVEVTKNLPKNQARGYGTRKRVNAYSLNIMKLIPSFSHKATPQVKLRTKNHCQIKIVKRWKSSLLSRVSLKQNQHIEHILLNYEIVQISGNKPAIFWGTISVNKETKPGMIYSTQRRPSISSESSMLFPWMTQTKRH